jgi:uncharacterized membrane protein YkvA (DUF1232 family)
MKSHVRHALARESFEEKIRKVARLIQLATRMKAERTAARTPRSPQKHSVNTVS